MAAKHRSRGPGPSRTPPPARAWDALVERATREAGAAPLAESSASAVRVWLERIEEWNARIDLTAARSPEELVDLMLGDVLFLAPRLAPGARVVDVGTGAGAPGLGLALVRPDLRVTLVEPLGKRVSFLRTVIGATGRTDVAIEAVRGEAVAGRHAWDVALSRATLPPPDWVRLGRTLVVANGTVVALLAREAPPDVEGATAESDEAYAWPLTGAARRAVLYRA